MACILTKLFQILDGDTGLYKTGDSVTFSLQPRASFSKLSKRKDIFSGIPLGSGCEKHEEQS